MIANTFKCGIFPLKPLESTRKPSGLTLDLKILTPKQMLQRLTIAPAQVKTGNTSEI